MAIVSSFQLPINPQPYISQHYLLRAQEAGRQDTCADEMLTMDDGAGWIMVVVVLCNDVTC